MKTLLVGMIISLTLLRVANAAEDGDAYFERRIRPELGSADWQALDDLLASLPQLADYGGVYQLYALSGENP